MPTALEILFFVGVAAAAIWDLRARRVPNALNGALLAGGLAGRAITGGVEATLLGLAGAAAAIGLLLVPFAIRWLGGGDVKFAAGIGAWLGPTLLLPALLAGLAGGALVGAAMALFGGAALRREVATNLKNAALSLSPPTAPRRERALLVPMAVPLGAAAVVTVLVSGGFHA